jgi:dTDP-4-dehydrorhamnose reductase
MDIPDSSTTYGKTQAAAEFFIQKTSLNYLIFRSCRLYGRGFNPLRPSWFENIQKKLKSNQSANYDGFVYTGFMDVFYLAMLIKICIEKEVSNRLFQISSQDIMSVYDFTKKYCEIFHDNKDLVSKGRWPFPIISSSASGPMGEEIFYKMDVSNVEGFLNINMPTIEESLKFSFKRWHGVEHAGNRQKGGDGVKFI